MIDLPQEADGDFEGYRDPNLRFGFAWHAVPNTAGTLFGQHFPLAREGILNITTVMVTKRRSPGQTVTTLSLPEALLVEIDHRAAALGISRSAYLCAIARADLASGGDIVLRELTPTSDDIVRSKVARLRKGAK